MCRTTASPLHGNNIYESLFEGNLDLKHMQSERTSGIASIWRECRDMCSSSSNSQKMDDVLAKALRQETAFSSVQCLVENLVSSSVAAFASVSLVSQSRDTFGVLVASGSGSELFPPLLHVASDALLSSRFSLFADNVFPISGSNWSIEDAIETGMPLFYNCSDDASALPQEASWLKRAGVRMMLSLPCVHNEAVQGVLTIGLQSKSVDHILVRKLQELCEAATPLVLESKRQLRHALTPRRQLRRFESQNDIAAAVMDELVYLDRIVVSRLQRSRGGDLSAAPATAATIVPATSRAQEVPCSSTDNAQWFVGAQARDADRSAHDSACSLTGAARTCCTAQECGALTAVCTDDVELLEMEDAVIRLSMPPLGRQACQRQATSGLRGPLLSSLRVVGVLFEAC